jgi:hypothetical protein
VAGPGRRLAGVVAALAVCGAAGAARAQVPRPATPGAVDTVRAPAPSEAPLRLILPSDTILFSSVERLPIDVRAARPMAIVATVAAADRPADILWRSDTVRSGAVRALAWDVAASRPGGWAPGWYVLAVTATDEAGVAQRAQRTLIVTRLSADTLPWPRALTRRDLDPESVEVRQTAPWAIFIGAGAGLLPSLLGRHELNDGRHGDAKAWIVVGSVTVAGFVAFFTGHRQEVSPENVARNALRRRDWSARLASVQQGNAQALAAAPYRIELVGGGR